LVTITSLPQSGHTATYLSVIDPPSFTVDAESGAIIGLSGRHRAFIAYKLGIVTIPVFIYYKYAGSYIENFGGTIQIPKNLELRWVVINVFAFGSAWCILIH
jgi:hypothetical protein